MIPIRSIAITLFSLIWMAIAIKQWVIEYPDLSNLLFAIGFFLVGLYVAYDQWFKKNKNLEIIEQNKDIQAIDAKSNYLEGKLINLANEK